MATYTISSAITTAGTAQSINTGDTVVVSSSGSLDSTGAAGISVSASAGESGGFDTIRVAGSVRGATDGFYDDQSGGNDYIHVAESGHIFGGTEAAIYVNAGSNTIVNNGSILDNAGGTAVHLSGGGNTITNAGTISASGNSAVYITGGSNTISNTGTIGAGLGTAIFLEHGHNIVTNSGTITGTQGILAAGDSSSITNSGTISVVGGEAGEAHGIDVGGTGSGNTVINTGTISVVSTGNYGSGVVLAGDSNTLVNSGTINASNSGNGSSTGVYALDTGNVVHNNAGGVITGGTYGVWFATGISSVVTNAGQIKGGETGIFYGATEGSSAGAGTHAHIKVLQSGSITGTDGAGIRVQGNGFVPPAAPLYDDGGGSSGTHIVDKGVILGGDTGIALFSGSNVVKVSGSGTVTGTHDYGITDQYGYDGGEGAPPLFGGDHIFNAGTIQGGETGIYLQSMASNHIHNKGSILGGSSSGIYIEYGESGSAGYNHISNKGAIIGAYGGIGIDSGNNVITNDSGGLIKAIDLGAYDAAGIWISEGSNTITNSGEIVVATNGHSGDAAVFAASGHNVIVNNAGGLITDFHGQDTSNAAIVLTGSHNSITNNGKIVGTVWLGDGAGSNVYDGAGGRLKGTVMGGSGTDTIVLGAGHSSVIGYQGGDNISVGTGPDNLIYTSPDDSNISAYDTVDGFKAGTDHFTFAIGGDFNGLASVTVNSLSSVSDGALDTAVAGHLDPYGAVALSVSSGLYAGDVFLIVDSNGDSHFDANPGDDYLVVLTHLSGTLSSADISTTVLAIT